jgi:hypothetical protein
MSDTSLRQAFRFELSGPFFKRDPAKTVRENIKNVLDEIAKLGERQVRALIAGKPGARYVVDNVRGYTTSTRGRRWELSVAVNLIPTGDKATSVRNAAILYGRRKGSHGTTVGIEERWHPFRNTKNDIARSRAFVTANLTRGIE